MLLIIFLTILTGCSMQLPAVRKLAEFEANSSCKIGVLPFTNESSYPQGEKIAKKIFLSEMANTGGFRVLQEGDVEDIYRQFSLYPNQKPTAEQIKMIGGRLNASLLIGGTVQQMSERYSSNSTATEMTLLLQIFDGANGQYLWTTYHHRRGSDYQNILHLGSLHTITGLLTKMSEEIIIEWKKQGMTPCAQ